MFVCFLRITKYYIVYVTLNESHFPINGWHPGCLNYIWKIRYFFVFIILQYKTLYPSFLNKKCISIIFLASSWLGTLKFFVSRPIDFSPNSRHIRFVTRVRRDFETFKKIFYFSSFFLSLIYNFFFLLNNYGAIFMFLRISSLDVLFLLFF